MNSKRNYYLLSGMGFGFAFLYIPIILLMLFSFNEAKITTRWDPAFHSDGIKYSLRMTRL